MSEITSTSTSMVLHMKDGEPVAITIYNGHPTLYSLVEMGRKEIEDFYDVNKLQENTK